MYTRNLSALLRHFFWMTFSVFYSPSDVLHLHVLVYFFNAMYAFYFTHSMKSRDMHSSILSTSVGESSMTLGIRRRLCDNTSACNSLSTATLVVLWYACDEWWAGLVTLFKKRNGDLVLVGCNIICHTLWGWISWSPISGLCMFVCVYVKLFDV